MQYLLGGRDLYYTYDYVTLCIRTQNVDGNYEYVTETIIILNSLHVFLKNSESTFQFRLKLHRVLKNIHPSRWIHFPKIQLPSHQQ